MHSNDPSYPYTVMEKREKTLRELFDAICGVCQPSIVCDVGAFNGDESFRFAKALPRSSIYAFEASHRNYTQFFLTNKRFDSLANFTAVHSAVSDSVGTADFHILETDTNVTDWRRAANSLLPRKDEHNATVVTVPCTTLDDYFANRASDNDSFALWIDVEGALDRVLRGGLNVLRRTFIVRAELEWTELWQGQALAQQIVHEFERLGFVLLGDTYAADAYAQSDAVFVRRNIFTVLR
ncbi:MAG: FkbM family methyltransferase [Planctomycetia bacterium]|jgi:FkbM family methyltransferase